ncbi:hypothetical protein GCM10028784_22810 [Myceligenerans cantabricum]
MPAGGSDGDPVRRAAQYRVDRETARERAEAETVAGDGPASGSAADDGGDDSGEAPRIGAMSELERSRFVDTVIDQAMRRGEFDNLPLEGKPIPGVKGTHDPDWWLKNLVERERITGVLPSAQLRNDDARLADDLDREAAEDRVREIVAEFNARVIDARRQLTGGPPVVTPTRDVDAEVAQWRARREARRAARPGSAPDGAATSSPDGRDRKAARRRKPWWHVW